MATSMRPSKVWQLSVNMKILCYRSVFSAFVAFVYVCVCLCASHKCRVIVLLFMLSASFEYIQNDSNNKNVVLCEYSKCRILPTISDFSHQTLKQCVLSSIRFTDFRHPFNLHQSQYSLLSQAASNVCQFGCSFTAPGTI